MAVRIRLSRIGRRNRPFWRIVAVDSRKKRDGAFIEKLGSYDPVKHTILSLNLDGIESWRKKGAECSDAVLKLIMRWKGSAESSVKEKGSTEVEPADKKGSN